EQVMRRRLPSVVKAPGIIIGQQDSGKNTPAKERVQAKEEAIERGVGLTATVPVKEREIERGRGRQAHDSASLPGAAKPLLLYPTRERLASLSDDYSRTAPKAEKGKVLSLNTTEHRYAYYMDGIKRKIELQWDYPNVAIKNGQQGTLDITFVLGRDGAIKSVKLDHGSGYPILDNAALTAVKLAAPFHPFPDGYELDDLTINASFEYVLNFLRGRN
ncbi:MAG: energy transducer TonB, partial [Thermodesulfobacteriota bacterium]